MVTPPDETTADPYAVIAALRQQLAESWAERDAALAEKAELAKALAGRTAELVERNIEYRERIEHQAATIDVLKAMSASPGHPQPVFDLIARQAAQLCNVPAVAVGILDGTMVRLVAHSGFDPAIVAHYLSFFPRPVGPDFSMGRAIINRRVERVDDLSTDPGHTFGQVLGAWTNVTMPMLREGVPLGAITMGRPAGQPFSDSQVALLETFAEQAVIAINSAETYRALQGRTSDLQEALEQQTATAEVLEVINSSPDDLMPVFNALLDRALRLCDGWQGTLWMFDGERMRATATAGYSRELTGQLNEWREIHPFQRRLAQGEPVFQIIDLARKNFIARAMP